MLSLSFSEIHSREKFQLLWASPKLDESLPGEEMKRSGHEVDPADGANVGGPDEGVAALELLNFGSNRFGRSENKENC